MRTKPKLKPAQGSGRQACQGFARGSVVIEGGGVVGGGEGGRESDDNIGDKQKIDNDGDNRMLKWKEKENDFDNDNDDKFR